MNQVIQLIEKSEESQLTDESKGLLNILKNYTKSFILLNQYDTQSLDLKELNENITYEIQYQEAIEGIKQLKLELIDKKKQLNCSEKKKTIVLQEY